MIEDSAYIKRLKERLRQKPDSKLFLSLAEELRRRDMIDEAIAVLLEGIKKNPEFITAHLALGRWYLSSDMLPEAKKEFLEAAEKSPNNIFARKGLAEIYKRMGEEESALEESGLLGEPEIESLEAPISASSKEKAVDRLNLFLETVKGRFAVSKKAAVKDRLNSLLNAIKIYFDSSRENLPPPIPLYKNPSYKD